MKKIFYLFIVIWFIQISYLRAQIITIDSLTRMLKSTKYDTTRSIVLARLCQLYSHSNPDTALQLAQQGLVLAKSIGYTHGEAACLYVMASTFSQTGNDAKALDLNLQALKKVEQGNDSEMLFDCLSNVSEAYWSQRDYKRALTYILQAKEIASGQLDSVYLISAFTSLGEIYEKLNQLDSARFYAEEGYNLAVKQRDTLNIGGALNVLGNTYSKMQQPAIAMDNYKLGIVYSGIANDRTTICESSLGMAKLFLQEGLNDSCLYYAKISFAIAKQEHNSLFLLNACNFLADYYKRTHVVDSAYAYLSAMVAIKDSIFNQERMGQIQSISFDESMRQKEIAAKLSAEKLEHKNYLQILGITVGIIILMSLFFVLSQSFIVHERWIKFLGIIGLLIVFEYFYIFIDPYVIKITNESPIWMLLALVLIAVLLEPLHNRAEHWITHKLIEKNKRLRLAAAKRTVARLEAESNKNVIDNS
jgi:tetratricopeptide (TPR) repeat protein